MFPPRRAPELAAALAVAAFFSCGDAQAQKAPYVLPATIGTSPVQVAPENPTRKSIEFCNPNASATLAVCPAVSRVLPNPAIVCAVNGAGSVTIPPNWCYKSSALPQGAPIPTAWNAVASAGASKITVFEIE